MLISEDKTFLTVSESGCGEPSFDDTVAADCDGQTCTFTCKDSTLLPNSLTATCGKKNKWSYDDKSVSLVTCSAEPVSEEGARSEGKKSKKDKKKNKGK